MTVEALKSIPVTNLDTVPPTPNTTGEGGPGNTRLVDGWLTISASASTTSTYRIVRVPSHAKIKSVFIESEAQGAGKVNVSVYYSDSTLDGTNPAVQGLIVPTTGDQFFGSDIDLAAAVATDCTNESGNYTLDKRPKPLWQALALTTDPMCYFDLVLVVHTTAITTGTGKAGLRVAYID